MKRELSKTRSIGLSGPILLYLENPFYKNSCDHELFNTITHSLIYAL